MSRLVKSIATKLLLELQQVVHHGDTFEEFRPVDRRHQPHARDHVPHGHRERGLVLVFQADDVVRCRPFAHKALVEPDEGGCDGRVVMAQALDEFDDEGGAVWAVLGAVEFSGEPFAAATGWRQEFIGECVRGGAGVARCYDRIGEATEVFDEEHAERDRNGPELADGQWFDALVGEDKAPEHFRVEAAVRVGDEGPGDAVDPGVSGERAAGELGEFLIVGVGEVVADLAQLFVDQVEVVDQPFGRGGDFLAGADGVGDQAVRFAEDAAVVRDARCECPSATPSGGQLLGGSEARGVLLDGVRFRRVRNGSAPESRGRGERTVKDAGSFAWMW